MAPPKADFGISFFCVKLRITNIRKNVLRVSISPAWYQVVVSLNSSILLKVELSFAIVSGLKFQSNAIRVIWLKVT